MKRNIRKEMENDGYSEAEIQDKEAYDRQVRKLLEGHASYEEYEKIARNGYIAIC